MIRPGRFVVAVLAMRALLPTLAILAASTTAHATPAMVRASSRGDAIVVARGAPGGGGTLWIAPDGATFTRHALPASRWILDAHVTAVGDVLLASTNVPRGGPIVIGRFVPGAAGPVEVEVAGSEGLSDARFLEGDVRLALVTSARAFVSDDGGRSFAPLAEWEADVYAFYASSGRVTGDGGVEVLAPTFNTCGSSDILEELTRLSARPRARGVRATPVRFASADFPSAATLMADGGLLTLTRRDGDCVLRARTPAGTRVLRRAPACWLLTATNRRFTVALAGAQVLRVAGLSSQVLGVLPNTDAADDVTPDSRGRALVLLDDGRVVRYAARAAPAVLLVAGP